MVLDHLHVSCRKTVCKKRSGYISCIEEIAYKRGFITKEQLVELAQPLLKTAYGKYLIEVAEGL